MAELTGTSPDVWDSGARSIVTLDGDAYFGIVVNESNNDAVVGLNTNNQTNDYREIEYGYEFKGAAYRIIEKGIAKSPWMPHDAQNRLYLLRRNNVVYYILRPAGTAYSAVFFNYALLPGVMLPGTITQVSSTTSFGSVFLDSAFSAFGDSINSASYGEGDWRGLSFEQPSTLPPGVTADTVSIAYWPLRYEAALSEFQHFGVLELPIEVRIQAPALAEATLELPIDFLAADIAPPFVLGRYPVTIDFGDPGPITYGISGLLPYEVVGWSLDTSAGANLELPLSGWGTSFGATDSFLYGEYSTRSYIYQISPQRLKIGIGFDSSRLPYGDLLDTAVITSDPSAVESGSNVLSETFVATNPAPDYSVWMAYYDSMVVSSYAAPGLRVTRDVHERFSADDLALAEVKKVELVLDSAVVSDVVDTASLAKVVSEVLETAELRTHTSEGLTRILEVTESSIIVDRATLGATVDTTDTAQAFDYATVYTALVESVLDAAVIASAVDTIAHLRADSKVSANVHDYASTTATLVANATANGYLTSYIYNTGALVGGTASDSWTANVVNWAMSRHDYSAVLITGRTSMYASSPVGLFEASVTAANLTATTGMSDLGLPALKGMPAAYTYATHSAPMEIAVTADVAGAQYSYSYTQMARDASEHRGVRVNFGRGLKSTYYQLTFQPTGYADILYCEPLIEPLRRRI